MICPSCKSLVSATVPRRKWTLYKCGTVVHDGAVIASNVCESIKKQKEHKTKG